MNKVASPGRRCHFLPDSLPIVYNSTTDDITNGISELHLNTRIFLNYRLRINDSGSKTIAHNNRKVKEKEGLGYNRILKGKKN